MVKRKFKNTQQNPKLQKQWIYIGLILLLTFIVFSPALKNEFTNWDDDLYVTENQTITSISIDELSKFGENFVGNFHPLTMISLALDYHFFGLNPFGYHLKNILFHLLNTLLVFLIVKRLSRHLFVSLFTALVFAIHPMHVESVAWVAERKDVLYSFYFLLGILFYQKYLDEKKIIFLIVTALAFVMSTLAKSAAVVFPVVLYLIDYFENRKFTVKSISEKIPFLAWSVFIGVTALNTQSQSNALGDFEYYSLFERFRFAAYGFMNYLIKFMVPFNLSSFHPYPDLKNLPAEYNLSIFGIIGLLIFMIVKGWKNRTLTFGLLFFLITIALVLQFITVGNAIIAERYTYIPYIGVAFIYGTFVYRVLFENKNKALKNLVGFFVVVQFIYFSAQTYTQTQVWKDSISLWNNVIEKYPDESGAYSNLGHHYRTLNDYDMALKNYNIAIEKDKRNSKAFSNRGKVWFDRGDFEKALSDYTASIEIDPTDASTFANRGATYGMLNDLDKSLSDLNKALELDPSNQNALRNRGIIYFQQGEFQKNIDDYQKYLQYYPNDPDIISSISICYNRLKQFSPAIEHVNRAIKINPNKGVYYFNRSIIYNQTGQFQNALNDALKAKQLGFNINDEYLNFLNTKISEQN